MDLREEASGVVPARHWYYRSKARVLRSLIEDRVSDSAVVWDVGAGSGFFAAYLLANDLAGSAVCIDPNYDSEYDVSVKKRALAYRHRPSGIAPDLVTLMDVLEHVEDPIGLLTEYAERARPGATFFITVPAHQWLWSDHDVFLGHYRRYTRALLTQTALDSGLIVDHCGYFFASILPAVWAVRARRRSDPELVAASDMKRSNPVVGALLEAVLGAERRLFGINALAGVSVVLVAHSPE